ncbi:MAG: helix-turn-helix transcriptional regulator [Clostridia bacterium]|nr:helix-turn-helix transcriptional regulator [Clostridia bacterium]
MKNSNFGKTLKILRTERNIKQGELAKILGCSQSMLTRWENGECEPTAPYVIAVSEYFSVSADFLLGINEY